MLDDDALAHAIEEDFESATKAGLSSRQLAMLRFAARLTESPQSMQAGDVEQLRAEEFTETDILHIVEVVAYYAYVNRIADGLGVELEPERER